MGLQEIKKWLSQVQRGKRSLNARRRSEKGPNVFTE